MITSVYEYKISAAYIGRRSQKGHQMVYNYKISETSGTYIGSRSQKGHEMVGIDIYMYTKGIRAEQKSYGF